MATLAPRLVKTGLDIKAETPRTRCRARRGSVGDLGLVLSATGPGHLAVGELTVNSSLYPSV